mmetsp:Transcript_4475/g.10271  ORF Transcript_4475/g.10271 Transcript_4475/m.10271 type:complete len:252 (-) Transcript_4475:325-1080(-)
MAALDAVLVVGVEPVAHDLHGVKLGVLEGGLVTVPHVRAVGNGIFPAPLPVVPKGGLRLGVVAQVGPLNVSDVDAAMPLHGSRDQLVRSPLEQLGEHLGLLVELSVLIHLVRDVRQIDAVTERPRPRAGGAVAQLRTHELRAAAVVEVVLILLEETLFPRFRVELVRAGLHSELFPGAAFVGVQLVHKRFVALDLGVRGVHLPGGDERNVVVLRATAALASPHVAPLAQVVALHGLHHPLQHRHLVLGGPD